MIEMHVRSGRSPKATITGQCMPIHNAVGAAPPLSSSVVPACSNLVKKIVFFFGSFLNKISEDRLLSIFHLKKLRNIVVRVKCKKTRVPSSHLYVL
jgi:hypothetical protein